MACALVLMGHYFLVAFPFAQADVPTLTRVMLRPPPWVGVWMFFTLSGFLMGKAFARGRYTLDETGSRLFLRNRFFRIAPIYFCAILLVSIYRYPMILQWRNVWMLLENFIFDYRGNLPLNAIPALWSVSTEVQFYLLVPMLMVFLLRARQRVGRAFVLVPILLICFCTLLRLHASHYPASMFDYAYTPCLPNLDLFVAGMSLNLLPRHLPLLPFLKRRLGSTLAVGSGLFYLLSCGLYGLHNHVHQPLEDLWVKGPVPSVLFAATFIVLAEACGKIQIGPGLLGRTLTGIQWVGTLTYCLYVFHGEVFIANAELLPRIHSVGLSLVHFPRVMVETFAVAAFFYYALEKPFDRKKRVSGSALMDAP